MDKKMNRLELTRGYMVGNSEIDDEHSKLFDIYNELVVYEETNGTRDEFAKLLTKMTDYSLKHFKREEEYMRKLHYPKFIEHKNAHRNYIYEVSMFNVRLLDLNPPKPEEIINFIEKWWINHISKTDVDYERFKTDNNIAIEY